MILHLVDDEKFVDMAFRQFETAYPGKNECIVLTEENSLKFIKTAPCKVVNVRNIDIQQFAEGLEKYSVIILHALNEAKLKVVEYLPEHIRTVWIGMGYDYYDLISKDKVSLFDEKTRSLYISLYPYRVPDEKKYWFQDESIQLIRILKKFKRKITGVKSKEDIINSIDFFAPVLELEYEMLKNAMYDEFKSRFADWNYGTLEDDFIRGFEDVALKSNNILIGNSASFSSNHLDAFEFLKMLDLTDRKIIVPLSYGDETYGNAVVQEGHKAFGDAFVPLINFMPIDEYTETISSCSTVIMNHTRQQALGNVIVMMYLGAAVFLKEKNPVYSFFKEKGGVVFSVEALEKDNTLINVRLSEKDIEQNRNILRQHWSRKVILDKTKELISTVTGNKMERQRNVENGELICL